MKIVHLITSLGLGGAEKQLKALVNVKLEKSSLKHIVISMQDEGVVGRELVKNPNITLYCLNLHRSLKGLWKLYQILVCEKPDGLQTWLYHADLLGLIVGKLARVPRIMWNIRCSNMDLSHYSKKTTSIVRMLRFASRFPDAVVTNSRAGQEFHTALGYNPRRWVCIPNGIDTHLFQPNPAIRKKFRQSLKVPNNAIVIGMLARVDPMKGHAIFLKAMEHLSHTHTNLYCFLAGKNTDKVTWDIIPPRLYCLGMMKDAPAFLNSLDIMVLSSAFGEGFPNVVGEAMACEIPTIVTDVGDAAALVQDPNQVIPPGDADKLALALERLLTLSSAQRKTIGQRGRQKIMSSYSISLMQQRYTTFYETLG